MTSPALPGFLATLAPLLDHYGYLAVAVLVLVEDFGVPSPGETVLIVAAVYAGAGQLNIVAVAVVAFTAAVVGDNIGYLIGAVGGRRLVLRYGRYVFLTPARLHTAEAFFTRHGAKVITIARFIEGLRQANGLIAGIAGMPWRRFLGYNALGAALWVALWTILADLAGTHITAIYHTAHRYQVFLAVAAAALIIAMITRHLWRQHRAPHSLDDRCTGQEPAPKEQDR